MRLRICKAAAKRLAASGYHGTSIKQVVEAANVSLGALQHHFPSKDDLVEATAEYLLGRSIKWFQRIKTELEKDRSAFAEVMRRSWEEQFTTPDYGALLEILVAARSDAALRKRIAPKLEDWSNGIEAEMRDLLTPIARDAKELNAIMTIGRCMMTGLLVHDGLLGDERHMRNVIDAWVGLVAGSARQR
ncbi:TetR/AcrR family transcriptional regulator [Hyphococcus sp.]|uniref:TetR/AcrR family transcriptional regulator n=1 Tax=Hyphococcus sp. TaxID=2038636 RepID=UPI003D11C29C